MRIVKRDLFIQYANRFIKTFIMEKDRFIEGGKF